MEKLFLFELATPVWLLLRFVFIIGVAAILIWLFITLYMHFFFKQDKQPFTLTWKFSILKSFIVILLFFFVYFFYLIKMNGIHWFNWKEFPISLYNIYFLISPEIFLLIGVIALFYYHKSQINKLIK